MNKMLTNIFGYNDILYQLIISFYKSTEKVSMYIFTNLYIGFGSGSSFVSL